MLWDGGGPAVDDFSTRSRPFSSRHPIFRLIPSTTDNGVFIHPTLYRENCVIAAVSFSRNLEDVYMPSERPKAVATEYLIVHPVAVHHGRVYVIAEE
jgi:hypothetical protein